MHDLWINVYKYDKDAIIENGVDDDDEDEDEDDNDTKKEEGYLSRDDFLSIVTETRVLFSPTKKEKKRRKEAGLSPYDSLIICYSGHGSLHGLLTSEYDGTSLPNGQNIGEIKIKEITDMFSGNDINRGSDNVVAVKRKTIKSSKGTNYQNYILLKILQ